MFFYPALVFDPEKLAQRDLASMRDLMEVCALWIGIKESVHSYVGSECFKKLQDMFDNGFFGLKNMGRYKIPGLQDSFPKPVII